MKKFLLKRLIPFIVSNVELDIDTIKKDTGTFVRVRAEIFGFVLLDRLISVSKETEIDVRLAAKEPDLS